MTRSTTAFIAASLFALAIAAASAAEPASTTIPDDTYGEGGTHQTVVNDKHELIREIFRDKAGMIREQFEREADGTQLWGFFIGEGTANYNWGGAIAIKPISGPAGAWTMTVYGTGTVTIKEYGFLSKAELDTEFAHWHSQMRGWINGFIRPAQPGGSG